WERRAEQQVSDARFSEGEDPQRARCGDRHAPTGLPSGAIPVGGFAGCGELLGVGRRTGESWVRRGGLRRTLSHVRSGLSGRAGGEANAGEQSRTLRREERRGSGQVCEQAAERMDGGWIVRPGSVADNECGERVEQICRAPGYEARGNIRAFVRRGRSGAILPAGLSRQGG